MRKNDVPEAKTFLCIIIQFLLCCITLLGASDAISEKGLQVVKQGNKWRMPANQELRGLPSCLSEFSTATTIS